MEWKGGCGIFERWWTKIPKKKRPSVLVVEKGVGLNGGSNSLLSIWGESKCLIVWGHQTWLGMGKSRYSTGPSPFFTTHMLEISTKLKLVGGSLHNGTCSILYSLHPHFVHPMCHLTGWVRDQWLFSEAQQQLDMCCSWQFFIIYFFLFFVGFSGINPFLFFIKHLPTYYFVV